MELALSLALVLAFAAVHAFTGALNLQGVPRSVWLSAAGGVAVAYVFVHILPELASHQRETFSAAAAAGGPEPGRSLYIVALAGLAAFYVLERLGGALARKRRQGEGDLKGPTGTFWLHLGSYAAYNVLIGYLLLQQEGRGVSELLLFGLGVGLHMLVIDHGLHATHGRAYDRLGRWVLASAPLLGWSLAAGLGAPPSRAVSAAFAFLAGGMILNVLKEELPEERESSLWAFLASATGSAALFLLAG